MSGMRAMDAYEKYEAENLGEIPGYDDMHTFRYSYRCLRCNTT